MSPPPSLPHHKGGGEKAEKQDANPENLSPSPLAGRGWELSK